MVGCGVFLLMGVVKIADFRKTLYYFSPMATFRPFRGIRPLSDNVAAVASRPYDVLDSAEARVEAACCPLSFLHVVKPEIDLPADVDPYGDEVYAKGRENFGRLLEFGHMKRDEEPSYYLYRLTMDGRSQTGVVGCCMVDEYYDGRIKKHELTRPVKEDDRVRHVKTLNANAEPVFFSYRGNEAIDGFVLEQLSGVPVYDFTSEDGIRHEFWIVSDSEEVSRLQCLFSDVPFLYVADGHHRTAAAARVGKERREANPDHDGSEEYNFFLAVLFPEDQLQIFDYNRVVTDLNGLSEEEFLAKLETSFDVRPSPTGACRPSGMREFGLYLKGNWFLLRAKEEVWDDDDPIGALDVTILSNHVLDPVLGITDLRRDKRIDFVGGIRGLNELEHRVDSGEMAVAFALHPVSMKQLLRIADADQIMPPKTTWFEPKLRSGLVVHELE